MLNTHIQDISTDDIQAKEIFVDSLNWLWPDSLYGIEKCLIYFVQNAIPSLEASFKTKNMIEINPIIDVSTLKVNTSKRVKEILINVAGMYVLNDSGNFALFYLESYLWIFFRLSLSKKDKI